MSVRAAAAAVALVALAGCGAASHQVASPTTATAPTSTVVSTTSSSSTSTTAAAAPQLVARTVEGVHLSVPAGWADVTPAAWHIGADHVDRLYADPGDPASELLVVSQLCVECAIQALAHPGTLVPGALHQVTLSARETAFTLGQTASSVSAFAGAAVGVPAGYATNGVEALSPSLTATTGPAPVSTEVVVTLPVADTRLATALLDTVALR